MMFLSQTVYFYRDGCFLLKGIGCFLYAIMSVYLAFVFFSASNQVLTKGDCPRCSIDRLKYNLYSVKV